MGAFDDPALWMVLLDRARRTGDEELAARAKRELARLEVRVIYGPPRPPRKGGPKDAA